MSTGFAFTSRETDKGVTLNSVDEAMCKHMGIECDDKKFSNLYQVATLYGVLMLKKYGGSHITEEIYEKWLADRDEEDRADEWEPEYRKFLLTDYKFDAWHQTNF